MPKSQTHTNPWHRKKETEDRQPHDSQNTVDVQQPAPLCNNKAQ